MRAHSVLTPLLGAVIGASFCLWIISLRLLAPGDVGWLMRTDWHFQFLSWHHFRSEPWHWPPGRVDRFYHLLDSTSIGYTDSIPLVAFALKPFAALLPMPFQYTAAWWMVCFALQGAFGVLLMRLWTPSTVSQLAGASLLVLMPTLLARLIHPSLCAHWAILWALWLYFRPAPAQRVLNIHLLALSALVGLIHPYLAAMVLALLVAVVIRHRRGALTVAVAVALVLAEWWLSGLFLLPAGELTRGSLADFSMNLLAIVTPGRWSRFLPPGRIVGSQEFEGFQYLGAGGLLVVAVGLGTVISSLRRWRWTTLVPLLTVCLLLAFYALSPRVTAGGSIVFDYSSPAFDRFAFFRVTGRFFWPAAYALVVASLAVIASRLPRRVGLTVLLAAVVLQLVDLHPAHAERRALARSPAFHRWTGELTSPVWGEALPHYDRIVMFHSLHCGEAPATFEGPAYLAGLYKLTINDGMASRWSDTSRAAYCDALSKDLVAGHVDDRAIYFVHRPYEPLLRQNAPHLVCGDIDGIRVCVTSRSYQYWRNAADLH